MKVLSSHQLRADLALACITVHQKTAKGREKKSKNKNEQFTKCTRANKNKKRTRRVGFGRLRRIHWFLSIRRRKTRSPSLRKSLINTHHSQATDPRFITKRNKTKEKPRIDLTAEGKRKRPPKQSSQTQIIKQRGEEEYNNCIFRWSKRGGGGRQTRSLGEYIEWRLVG